MHPYKYSKKGYIARTSSAQKPSKNFRNRFSEEKWLDRPMRRHPAWPKPGAWAKT